MSKTTVRSLSEVGWKVYRVQTTSSQYHLGIFEGGMGRRRCAVLRGMSRALGRNVDLQDSAPMIGGKLLFDVPPSEWVGKQLEIGTATTSAVQSVDEENDRRIVTAITSTAALAAGENRDSSRTSVRNPVAQQQTQSRWAPYPEDFVEYVEAAARLLRATYERKSLMADLRPHQELFERFQLALSECLLMLKAIGGRVADARKGPG